MRKVILDVDTGIDDSLAIAYLLSRPEAEVLGITTSFGNVLIETAYRNTVDLLNVLKRNDVKVYRGAAHALNETGYELRPGKKRVHGDNGIGNVQLSRADVREEEKEASDFLAEAALKYGEELTIIAVGPMTNLVRAYQKQPEAIARTKIVIMGGALTVPGNTTPFAEANIYADPEAARILFEADLHVTMIGLDVTHQTMITGKDLDVWKKYDNEASRALCAMSAYYYQNEGDCAKGAFGCLHDPLAVEAALNPEIISNYFSCDLTVDTEGISAGRTTGQRELTYKGPRKTKVALEVHEDEFVAKFTESVADLLSKIRD